MSQSPSLYGAIMIGEKKKRGARLANEFSWSFSRHNTFSECQKKYWYIYYGAWEGWPKTPFDSRQAIDPLRAHLYMLKQIQGIPQFVGSCVHETIEHFLKREMHQTERKNFVADEFIQYGLNRFRRGLEETRKGLWKEAPKKHANLFEYYFREGDQDPFSQEIIQAAEEKIATCLKNWVLSPVAKMAENGRAKWISVEELASFQLQGHYKIIVVVDFAMKWRTQAGDALILFDWKTGAETEKTEEQLYSYALYGNRALGFPLDRIILSPFYLMTNSYSKIGYQQERPLERERIEQTEKMMLESCASMAKFLPSLIPAEDDQGPDVRHFAYTEKRGMCVRCPFKRVCEKAQYEQVSQEKLKELVCG
jgi:hypothetical protein